MRYDENPYEDELDRLRARRQRKKSGQPAVQPDPRRGKPSFRVYDETDGMPYDDGWEDSTDFEEIDLDDDGAEIMDFYGDYEDGEPEPYRQPRDGRQNGGRMGQADRDRGGYSGRMERPDRDRGSYGGRMERTDRNGYGGQTDRTGMDRDGYNSRMERTGEDGGYGRNSGGRNNVNGKNSGNSGSGKKKKRKKRVFFKILFLAAILLAGYLGFQWIRDDSYWTIAVFGVDSRNGNVGKGALSDVEMICSINKKTGEIRLVSVFRDSYLRIDQKDEYDKINEAYFKGGHKQAVDALMDNLDLQIDDYATFNWKAVVDGINVLGGVDIEITDKEFAYINSFITETVNSTGIGSVQLEHSGMNHLDGVQAVAYARLRLMDTDFNRTERQRKVLGQAMEKAKNADFNTLKTLVGAVYPQISTSVGVDNLIGMAKNAHKYYIGQTSGFPFSHQEIKIGKKSCVIPTTLESNVIQLHSFLYDNAQYTPSAGVKKISAHISEVSGLGDPGKDTESGKNVGAEGNTGGNQGSGQAPQSQAPEKPAETAPAETEPQPSESESEPETSIESESGEEPGTEIPEEESSSESSEESSAGIIEQPSGNDGGSQAGPGVGSSQGGGLETTKAPEPSETPSQTNASLEAPGQGNGSENTMEQGPGV